MDAKLEEYFRMSLQLRKHTDFQIFELGVNKERDRTFNKQVLDKKPVSNTYQMFKNLRVQRNIDSSAFLGMSGVDEKPRT